MYEYDADERDLRSLGGRVAVGAGVLLVAALGWFVVRAQRSDHGGDAGGSGPSPTATTFDDDTGTSGPTPTTTALVTTTAPEVLVASYETMSDGTPLPIIATFAAGQITLQGVVPDQAAKERFQALAVANAKPGQAETVDNRLTINPVVPRNIGVRVVELTSARFADRSSDILPPHAGELDRVVTFLNAHPHVTTLIIGHSDQRGDDLSNYAISEARATAVKHYLVASGIDPSRLSSRAVAESDLLTLADHGSELALNRRTELVFFGLLNA